MADLPKKFSIILLLLSITKIIAGGYEILFGFIQSAVGLNLEKLGKIHKHKIMRSSYSEQEFLP